MCVPHFLQVVGLLVERPDSQLYVSHRPLVFARVTGNLWIYVEIVLNFSRYCCIFGVVGHGDKRKFGNTRYFFNLWWKEYLGKGGKQFFH